MASHPDQQLVDTRVHYVLLSTSNGWTPAVLSLSSTQVKKSKQWMSRMRGMQIPNRDGVLVDAPMASHIWHLTTVAEGNDKGTWFGLKVGQAVLQLRYACISQGNGLEETGSRRSSYRRSTKHPPKVKTTSKVSNNRIPYGVRYSLLR